MGASAAGEAGVIGIAYHTRDGNASMFPDDAAAGKMSGPSRYREHA
jgi:hypothetical protein